MPSKYDGRAYCRLCEKWIPLEQCKKYWIPKLQVHVYYCPIHKRQVRLKARGRKMSTVPEELGGK